MCFLPDSRDKGPAQLLVLQKQVSKVHNRRVCSCVLSGHCDPKPDVFTGCRGLQEFALTSEWHRDCMPQYPTHACHLGRRCGKQTADHKEHPMKGLWSCAYRRKPGSRNDCLSVYPASFPPFPEPSDHPLFLHCGFNRLLGSYAKSLKLSFSAVILVCDPWIPQVHRAPPSHSISHAGFVYLFMGTWTKLLPPPCQPS